MDDKYIGEGNKLCWKCGGSGIDFTKYFSDNREHTDWTCSACKGKGYTKELIDLRPEFRSGILYLKREKL